MLKLKGAFLLIWEAAPGWAIARGILLILQGLLPLASLYLTKLIIDTLADSVNVSDKTVVFEEIILFLVLIAVVTITTTACISLNEMVNAAQSQRIVDSVEATLYRKAIEVDFECYEDSHYYDILQQLRVY